MTTTEKINEGSINVLSAESSPLSCASDKLAKDKIDCTVPRISKSMQNNHTLQKTVSNSGYKSIKKAQNFIRRKQIWNNKHINIVDSLML
jgi:hypothetical protein